MEKENRCMICSKPIDPKDMYICIKKDMQVALCHEHSEDCKENCETCIHSPMCPASTVQTKLFDK